VDTSAESEPALLPVTGEVIDRLVANHRQFLAFVERRVGSRSIADDILQDAFVRSLNKLDTLHDEESAVAWFYRMLRNAVVDRQRRDAGARRRSMLQRVRKMLSVESMARSKHFAVAHAAGGHQG
jgi:RNA polymerase sigma-70 factor (ECF subfamily)